MRKPHCLKAKIVLEARVFRESRNTGKRCGFSVHIPPRRRSIHIDVDSCIHVHMSICVYVCIYVGIQIFMCLCGTCSYACRPVNVYIRVCICMYISLSPYVRLVIYIYIYVYTHTYTCMLPFDTVHVLHAVYKLQRLNLDR